jgi:hypothetical protein
MVGTMPSDVCTASVPEMKSFWTSITKSASSDHWKQNECGPGAYVYSVFIPSILILFGPGTVFLRMVLEDES